MAASRHTLRAEPAACGRGPRHAVHSDSAQRGRARRVEPAPTRIGAPRARVGVVFRRRSCGGAVARWRARLGADARISSCPWQDIKRKAVMVAATGQHHGKTTVTLGMVQALLARKWQVAYQKPVGQQTGPAALTPSFAVRWRASISCVRSFLTCAGGVAVPVLDTATGEEMEIDRDVDIFKFMWPELVGSYADSSPVAFPPGFTRMVLDDKVQTTDLVEKCLQSFKRLVDTSDCALCVVRCCRCARAAGCVVVCEGWCC